ncbi:MAG: hypothetical protein ACRDLK_02155 [Gaiellaceae bacterium]
MHLRPPAFAHGIVSFIWAVALGAFIWIGGIAVGLSSAMGFVIGAAAGFGIFLFVRICGDDEPQRPL